MRLLLGCGYAREPRLAALAARVAHRLLGAEVELVAGCCGYPERAAGDARAADESAAELLGGGDLIVLDASCAHTLSSRSSSSKVQLLVDLAVNHPGYQPTALGPLRYHDPCALGRGLRRFEEPRRLIEAINGAAPLEFARNREAADCSGGGGLLPLTMPEVSEQIARERLRQARGGLGDDGGALEAPIVTACAASGRRFRRSGADVLDLVEVVAMGLGVSES